MVLHLLQLLFPDKSSSLGSELGLRKSRPVPGLAWKSMALDTMEEREYAGTERAFQSGC